MTRRHPHLTTNVSAVVFIDPRVDDVAALLAGLKPGEKAFILDPKKDGLAQMARDLRKAHLTGLASISVVAHGAEGALTLGKSTITDGDLAAHAAALAKIGAALKTNGTLNLYACNTAAGEDGRTFIADLSKYTGGADVAAATHQIGRAPGGENWTLDATTGAPVSASTVPFTNAAMQSYQGTLSGVFRVPKDAPSNTVGNPFNPSPVFLSNGNIAVAFLEVPDTDARVLVDAFDSGGNRIGNEIVNAVGNADDFYTATTTVAGVSPGTFWVLTTEKISADKGRAGRVIDEEFQVSGNTFTKIASKTLINTTAGDAYSRLTVVKLDNGNYVAGWAYNDTSTTSSVLQVRTFDSNFNALSPATTVSLPGQTAKGGGTIRLSTSGNSVNVVYTANPSDNGHNYGLTFDVATDGTISNKTTPVDLSNSSMQGAAGGVWGQTALSGNKILVTYNTVQNGTTGANLNGIIYNRDFSIAKDSFQIAASTPSGSGVYAPQYADEVGLPNGGFIVTYVQATANYQSDIFARLYDANNNPLTNAFLVDTPTANTRLYDAQLVNATGGNGGLAISWSTQTFSSDGTTATVPDINARVYTDIGPTSTGAAATLASQYATPTSNGTSVSTLFGSAYNSLLNHPFAGVAVTSDSATASQGTWQYSSNGGASWTSIATNVSDTNATIIAAGDAIRFNPVNGYTGTPGGLTVRVWDGQDGFTADSTGKNISAYIFDTSGTSQSTSSFEGAFAGKTDALGTTVIAPPTIVSGGYKISLLAGASASASTPGALTGDTNPSTGSASGLSVVDVSYGSNSAVAAGTSVTGAYGTLTLNANGSFTYVANQATAISNAASGSHPTDTFTYDVSNGRAVPETFTATIDRAPTGTGIVKRAPEGATTTGAAGAAFANETDKDGDALSVASVSYTNPANGNVTNGTVGQSIAGRYGELTLKADGSYSYAADNTVNYAADTLAGTPTVDKFTYTSSDGLGGATGPQTLEIDVACFAAGTRILTARGDIAVEALAVGDLALTASGALRPIRWLGHRTLDCRRHPHPRAAMPIHVAAHAFAPNRPVRDLRVSPGHAICVDVVGEVLIPAAALINGATVTQEDVDSVTYWHVELDSHDVILAENLPTESYIDCGNRGFFAKADVVVREAPRKAGVPDQIVRLRRYA